MRSLPMMSFLLFVVAVGVFLSVGDPADKIETACSEDGACVMNVRPPKDYSGFVSFRGEKHAPLGWLGKVELTLQYRDKDGVTQTRGYVYKANLIAGRSRPAPSQIMSAQLQKDGKVIASTTLQ
ncbi:MAG: hypothetical protein WD898_00520 [Candidatus Paceibacterota bacterium]